MSTLKCAVLNYWLASLKSLKGIESNWVGVNNPGRQHAFFGPDFRLNGSPVACHCEEMDMRNCTGELGALHRPRGLSAIVPANMNSINPGKL